MWDKPEQRKALVAELRAWALRTNQSRAQVAQRFGVSRSTVTRWFEGQRVPTLAAARKLAALVPAAERKGGVVQTKVGRDNHRDPLLLILKAAQDLRNLLQPYHPCEVNVDDRIRLMINVNKTTAFCLEFDQKDPLLVYVLGADSKLHATFRASYSAASHLLTCIRGFQAFGEPLPPSCFEKAQIRAAKRHDRLKNQKS